MEAITSSVDCSEAQRMFNCTRFDAPSMLATDPLLSPLWYTLLCATHQSDSTKHVHSLKTASYIHSSTFALIRRCIHSMNAVRAHCGARHQSIVTSMQPLWGIIIWSISVHTRQWRTQCTAAPRRNMPACTQPHPQPNPRRAVTLTLSPSPSPSPQPQPSSPAPASTTL